MLDDANINSAIPSTVKDIAEIICEIEDNRVPISEPDLGRLYVCAKQSKSQSLASVARAMNWSVEKLYNYNKNNSKVAAVIKLGFLEARAQIEENVSKSLYNAAMGNLTVEEQVVEEFPIMDYKTGLTVTGRKVKTTTKQIPANVNAMIKILEKLNPDWTTKQQVDVNVGVNHNISIFEDKTITMDYSKLSPEALEQIIAANLTDNKDYLYRREDGLSTQYLDEFRKKKSESLKASKEKIKKIEQAEKTRQKKSKKK